MCAFVKSVVVCNSCNHCLLTDGPRPSQKEIISLRAFMLLFLKQLILKVRQNILNVFSFSLIMKYSVLKKQGTTR